MTNTTLTLVNDPQELDENILVSKDEKGRLIIIVDPTVELGLSASEKSINIATTHGNKALGKMTIGMNLYKPNPNKPKGSAGRTAGW